RVHHASRRRGGGVAACGARGAAGEAADHRIFGREHACGPERTDRRFRATAARTWLDRGPYRRDRVSVGRGRSERFAEIATELVKLKVDVIVTSSTPAVIARMGASRMIRQKLFLTGQI